MSNFSFRTDAKSDMFCRRIADEMIRLFGISEYEAIGRINRHFAGKEWLGPTHIWYHEGAEDWARNIYYEEDSYWWMEGRQPQPKPYP